MTTTPPVVAPPAAVAPAPEAPNRDPAHLVTLLLEQPPAPAAPEAPAAAPVEPEPAPAAEPEAEAPAAAPQDSQIEQLVGAIDAIHAKLDAGKELSAKEEKTLEQAPTKLAAIRAALEGRTKGQAFDVFEQTEGVAELVIEQAETIEQLRAGLAELRADADRRRGAEAADQQWAAARAAYPGVNVEAVWEKAVADQMAAAGLTPDRLGQLSADAVAIFESSATTLFKARAEVATKSVAGKPPAAPAAAAARPAANNGTTTRQPQPPVTPGGARVTQTPGVTAAPSQPPSPETAYVQRAMSLLLTE